MKHKLPAIEVEVPRMEMVVYVSDKIGVQDKKWTAMFTAEIVSPEDKYLIELQSFHLQCKSEKEARTTAQQMRERLEDGGPYPFIQKGI